MVVETPPPESLITFPCNFPIKVMGNNTPTFAQEIIDIVTTYDKKPDPSTINLRVSREKKYISLTVIVHVENQIQLDNIYQALTKHPDVRMVL
jgi:putative lipoic acid-binding regulatory protein